MPADSRGPAVGEADVVDALTRVVVRACRRLAESGRPQEAGRLAADAWVAVRTAHPHQTAHLDGAMHHIARLEQEAERRSRTPAQAGQRSGPSGRRNP